LCAYAWMTSPFDSRVTAQSLVIWTLFAWFVNAFDARFVTTSMTDWPNPPTHTWILRDYWLINHCPPNSIHLIIQISFYYIYCFNIYNIHRIAPKAEVQTFQKCKHCVQWMRNLEYRHKSRTRSAQLQMLLLLSVVSVMLILPHLSRRIISLFELLI